MIYIDLQLFLSIYIFIFLMMIFYNIACLFQRKFVSKSLKRYYQKLDMLISKNKQVKEPSKEEINMMIKKLSHTNYLLAFSSILEKEKKDYEFQSYLRKRVVIFTKLAQKYKNKSNEKKSFFSYVLSSLPIEINEKEYIEPFLIENILLNSISLRENSLRALYCCCREETIVKVIKLLSRNNINHNEKLLADGLYETKKNNKLLADLLIENYNELNDHYKICIIKFITRTNLNYNDIFLQLLKDHSQNKEVNLALICYFKNHLELKAVPLLVDYLNNYDQNNWEYADVSALVLGSYKQKIVLKALEKAIYSSNWHIKNSSSSSLVQLVDSLAELDPILTGDDKYAKEILNYKLVQKGKKKNA